MTILRSAFPWLCLALMLPMSVLADSGSRFGGISPASTNTPLAGDLNPGQDGDELGYFSSENRAFYLCKERFAALRLTCIEYPVPGFVPGVPLLGRWSRDDTVARPALYNPATGRLSIFRYAGCEPVYCDTSGALELDTFYDLNITDAIPVAGDWNGSDVDTVALVTPWAPGGPGKRGQVHFFDDGFRSSTSSDLWGLDLNGYAVVAGDWPGTNHAGDSLGFYDEITHDALLLDGLASVELVTVPLSHQGLTAFDFDNPWGGSIGFYYPPVCSNGHCHRVTLWKISFDGLAPASPVHPPTPLLDSRFPDDPGDPNP